MLSALMQAARRASRPRRLRVLYVSLRSRPLPASQPSRRPAAQARVPVPHPQTNLCHISLMPLGKPTIISQAERICAQKVPLPYSGAEESAPSLTGLGMTMRVWVRIDSLARNFNSRRRFNAAPPPMSERFAPARRQNARNRRKNRVVPAGDKTGGIPGPEKRIQESR